VLWAGGARAPSSPVAAPFASLRQIGYRPESRRRDPRVLHGRTQARHGGWVPPLSRLRERPIEEEADPPRVHGNSRLELIWTATTPDALGAPRASFKCCLPPSRRSGLMAGVSRRRRERTGDDGTASFFQMLPDALLLLGPDGGKARGAP
jgi:hypothetical protein